MQPAPTDKLLKPPRGGEKAKKNSGVHSVGRCARNLSGQISALPVGFSEEDIRLIGKTDRHPAGLGLWWSRTSGGELLVDGNQQRLQVQRFLEKTFGERVYATRLPTG